MHLPNRPLAFACFLFVISAGVHAQQPLPEDSLTKLDFHLGKIRKEYAMSRFWGGGMALVLGSVIGVGGTVAASATRAQVNNDNVTNGITFASIGVGSVLAAGGLVTLLWKTEYESIPEAYADLPRGDADEIRRRVLYGETSLQSLADRSRVARFIGAGTMAATGLAMVVTSMSGSTDAKQGYLYQGLINVGLSAVIFFVKTMPETENDAYLAWKSSQN